MDKDTIMDYFREKTVVYSLLSHREVLESLQYKEYVEIEEKKNEIFKKRLDYFVLAKCLKEAMVNQTGFSQFKRYFVEEIGMDDHKAQSAADQYNKAYRAYKNFEVIVRNVAEFPKIDIRDLTINELPLAVNKDWVRRRSAMVKGKKRKAGDVGCDYDGGNVQESVQHIFSSDWYKKAKLNPSLVAHIMNEISSQVVKESQYAARR